MRRLIGPAISAILVPTCYFLLLDYARPALTERHLRLVWWVILCGYVILVFLLQFGKTLFRFARFYCTGALLLVGCVFSYDPTINPRLASLGLGHVWMVFLTGFFVWLYIL